MRIAIIGAGAIGGTFAGRFATAGADIVLYDHDAAHVEAIQKGGLVVEREGGGRHTLSVTADPAQIGTVDLAVVLVDCNATRAGAEVAAGVIGDKGAAITLQNGIGNIEILVETMGASRVMAGSTMNSAARLAPGRVAHTHLGKTMLGELDGSSSERLARLAALFEKGGLPVETTGNIQGHVWQKFILNAGLNALAAITRLRPGQLVESPEASVLVRRILDEVLAVVAAEGIVLPNPDPRDYILGHAVGRMNRPSMLQHVEQRRRTEIDALNGALLRVAERHAISCPVNETIVQLIKAIETYPAHVD